MIFQNTLMLFPSKQMILFCGPPDTPSGKHAENKETGVSILNHQMSDFAKQSICVAQRLR